MEVGWPMASKLLGAQGTRNPFLVKAFTVLQDHHPIVWSPSHLIPPYPGIFSIDGLLEHCSQNSVLSQRTVFPYRYNGFILTTREHSFDGPHKPFRFYVGYFYYYLLLFYSQLLKAARSFCRSQHLTRFHYEAKALGRGEKMYSR